jgi:hypothetical protein
MFAFLMTISILVPPPIAMRMGTPISKSYTIKSAPLYQGKDDCKAAIADFMSALQERLPIAKVNANVECYQSETRAA